jgi:hypothetical protein
MKVNLTFDLADPHDYKVWSKIAAAMSSGEPAPAGQTQQAPRPKIAPAPQVTETAAAPAPAAAPATAQAPTPQATPSTSAPAPAAVGNGAIPSIQDLREKLAALGAASSPGEAADFLRLKIGAPNLSSIPEDKRTWAMQILSAEIGSREAMA